MSTFVDEGKKPWDARNVPKAQEAAKGNDNHRSLSKDRTLVQYYEEKLTP